jgi:hypothetical protein
MLTLRWVWQMPPWRSGAEDSFGRATGAAFDPLSSCVATLYSNRDAAPMSHTRRELTSRRLALRANSSSGSWHTPVISMKPAATRFRSFSGHLDHGQAAATRTCGLMLPSHGRLAWPGPSGRIGEAA